jgi:hypothetical protein
MFSSLNVRGCSVTESAQYRQKPILVASHYLGLKYQVIFSMPTISEKENTNSVEVSFSMAKTPPSQNSCLSFFSSCQLDS